MSKTILRDCLVAASLLLLANGSAIAEKSAGQFLWTIDSMEEWDAVCAEQRQFEIKDGFAIPTAKQASFSSTIKTFAQKRSVKSIVFEQSPVWQNWNPVENIGPSELSDAAVFLALGSGDYWLMGRDGRVNMRKKGSGLNQGYHAWHSSDMENWVHHGPVTEKFSRWVTTAEYVDGKFYIYYDYPNDQDPHLYIDDDLTDGKPGKNMGIAFKDPSHGSDCTFFRDTDGRFHVIYEDWSPINAKTHAWDSPLAGHAVSPDGIKGFEILSPAVDERTTPTGKTATFKHPHWVKEHPDWKSNIAEYQVHSPEQNAFGDWASIKVGAQYYLFGDYDPAGQHGSKSMSTAWFTSSSLDKQFEFCGNIGQGHPDPAIGFAEGQFLLITQSKTDFASPGPWVESVDARVGVDTDKDGKIDQWSDWQEVKESYGYKTGFVKHIDKTAAAIDLSSLPEGYGFQFEFKITDTTENKSKPIMDRITIHLD